MNRHQLEAAAKAERDAGTERGPAFNALVMDGALERVYLRAGDWVYRDNTGAHFDQAMNPIPAPVVEKVPRGPDYFVALFDINEWVGRVAMRPGTDPDTLGMLLGEIDRLRKAARS